MSILTGRWRCDYQPSGATNAPPPIQTWHATQEAAEAEEKIRGDQHGGRAVAWYWPGEYVETPAEEAARTVRQQLGDRLPWLKETA